MLYYGKTNYNIVQSRKSNFLNLLIEKKTSFVGWQSNVKNII